MSGSFGATVSALSRLLERLRLPKSPFIGSVALLLAAGALEGAPVALLVPLFDALTNSQIKTPALFPALSHALDGMTANQRVAALGAAIVFVVLLKNVLTVSGYAWLGVQRSKLVIELRQLLLDRVLGAPPVILERNTSGAITDVFVAEAYRVLRIFEAAGAVFLRGTMVLSYVLALLLLSWRFLAMTLVLGLVLGLIAMRLGRHVLSFGRNLSRASTELARIVTEVVGGVRVIRTTASAETYATAFSEPNRAHAAADFGSSLALTI